MDNLNLQGTIEVLSSHFYPANSSANTNSRMLKKFAYCFLSHFLDSRGTPRSAFLFYQKDEFK